MTTLIARPVFGGRESDHVTQMRLSLLAERLGTILVEVKTLQGSANPERGLRQGELIVQMMHDGQVDTAINVARRAYADHVRAACAEVLEAWEDSTMADFLEDRLAEVVAKVQGNGGGLVLSAYHTALREPERFCKGNRCGVTLTEPEHIQRGLCRDCWIGNRS